MRPRPFDAQNREAFSRSSAMQICLFLMAHDAMPDTQALCAVLTRVGAVHIDLHCSRRDGVDPFLQPPEQAPVGVIQAYFDDLLRLERALVADGRLAQALAQASQTRWTWQAMAVRRYLEGTAASSTGTRCGYWVAYIGHAEGDDRVWLHHYLRHHPPIMARLPRLRYMEVCTRMDVSSGLSLPLDDALQRNQVVFDDLADLKAALASDVRHELRADFHKFPPFKGEVPHVVTDITAATPEPTRG
jgi:hypothetical protein